VWVKSLSTHLVYKVFIQTSVGKLFVHPPCLQSVWTNKCGQTVCPSTLSTKCLDKQVWANCLSTHLVYEVFQMMVVKLLVHANVTFCDKRYMWPNSLSRHFAVMVMLINGKTVAMDKMGTVLDIRSAFRSHLYKTNMDSSSMHLLTYCYFIMGG